MLWDLTPLQRELADYMSDLSKEAYCAGWMSGLEYDLWKAVVDGPYQYSRLLIDAAIIARLRRLSDEIGGWIIFHDDWEETFVPIAEWRSMYEHWLKHPKSSSSIAQIMEAKLILPTFADQEIPFPFYDAPTDTATGFLPWAVCSRCGRTDAPGFRLGIGDYLMQPCRDCGSAVGFAAEETEPAPVDCLICGTRNEFAGSSMRNDGRQICYPCLRGGGAALTKDTEFGMVSWREAVAGVTHCVPRSALPHDLSGLEAVEKEEDWVGVRVPTEHLWELLRTPTYSTWQGERWLFCRRQPMVYRGEWKQKDWNRAAVDGDGERLFQNTVQEAQPDLWQWADGGSVICYVFSCHSGGGLKAHWGVD